MIFNILLLKIISVIKNIAKIYSIEAVKFDCSIDIESKLNKLYDMAVEIYLTNDSVVNGEDYESYGCIIGYNNSYCGIEAIYPVKICILYEEDSVKYTVYTKKIKIENLEKSLLNCFKKYKFLTKDEIIIKEIIE